MVRPWAGAPARAKTLGRYRVITELARGGMGVVYLALKRGPGAFNKLLVLKELRPEFFEDGDVLAMFLEEARLAAFLSHPNVVPTIEAGSDGDRHFIVMEYFEGQSLHRVVSRARKLGTPVPFELQSAVLCGALNGLAYAHAATDYDGQSLGIVHRDVSPQNVLIGYDGQVKLVDFGIAKARGSFTDTRVGLLKGRISYMAPEQAAGGNVDARADLFSIGVMLWEAATGRRFWSGIGTDVQVLRALLLGDADTAQAREMSEVEPDLRGLITRATAFDPSKRPTSATHLLDELRTVLAKRPNASFEPPEVGRFVQGLFGEERAQLQIAVAEALERGDAAPEEATRASSGSRVPPISERPPEVQAANPPPFLRAGPSEPPAFASPPASTSPPAEGRALVAISVVVLLGAVATLVGLLAVRHSAVAAAQSLPAPAAVAPPAPSAAVPVDTAPEPAPPETVHVVVRASPPRAKIVIDRNLVFENPCVATLAKDGASHSVHVEADGYTPRDETFDARADAVLVIALEPRKATWHWVPPVPHPAPPLAAPAPAPVSAAPPAPPPPAPPASAAPAPAATGTQQRRINTENPYTR